MINPTGSKLWRFKYRFAGKEKLLSFGRYPDIGLKDARVLRDKARAELATGNDPSITKREKKAHVNANSANTFAAVAAQYLEKKKIEGRAAATLKKNAWIIWVILIAVGLIWIYNEISNQTDKPLTQETITNKVENLYWLKFNHFNLICQCFFGKL